MIMMERLLEAGIEDIALIIGEDEQEDLDGDDDECQDESPQLAVQSVLVLQLIDFGLNQYGMVGGQLLP